MKTEHNRKQRIVFSYSLPTSSSSTTTSRPHKNTIRRMNRSRSFTTTEYSEPYFRSMDLSSSSSSSLPPSSVNKTNARQEIRMKTPPISWPKTRVTPTNIRPNTITRQKWTLQQSDVHTLPDLYPLDRSHIILKDDVSVPTLCKRITESMRVQNIVGLWDMSYPSKIRCDSDKMLLFEINVWKKKNNNKNKNSKKNKSRSKSVSFCDDNDNDGGKGQEDNDGPMPTTSSNLIVEIHYLSGDALEFHRVKSNLWNAIDDGLDQNSSTGTSTLRKHCRPPLPKFLDDFKTTSPTTTTSSSSSFDMMALNETLSTMKELCDKGTLFHRKMALEILSFSTDTSITNRAFATHMSKVIVLGLNPIGRYLRDVIRSEIINFDTTNDDDDDDDDNENDATTFKRIDDSDIVQNTIHAIHQEAIKVLNNAFSLIIQHCQFQSSLDKVSKEVNEFWITTIIPALIYDLDHVSIRPHMANVSSKCLKNVCLLLNMCTTTSLDTNGQRGGGGGVVKKEEILPVVERALVYGKENYSSLEKESLNLMMVLSQ